MTPKYIDIHSHTNFSAFDEDRDAVIARALEAGVWMINVGTQKDTSKKAVELAEKYEKGVYACVGLHPIHTSASFHDEKELGKIGNMSTSQVDINTGFTPVVDVGNMALPRTKGALPAFTTGFTSRGEIFDKEIYRDFLKSPKTVAVGECGLDYFHLDPVLKEKQIEAFEHQIELALEYDKPLMLHIRNGSDKKENAYQDAISILKKYQNARGNVHFFAGGKEEAQLFLDIGWTLSFTGVVTFAKDYEEVIRYVPLESIMSETDAPYVAPIPYRGKRNEPAFVVEVVKKIAEIKGISLEKTAETLFLNAKRVFGV